MKSEAQEDTENKVNEEKLSAEKEVAEYYEEMANFENAVDLEQFHAPITRSVNKLCQGFSNLLFVKGRGGVGKSYAIRKTLIENEAEFVELAGDVTEAYLYRLIYENNGKIIWCKDTVKLLQSPGAINILKGACETERKKILTKYNYSKDQDDLPNRFICRCKFIFDYNNLFGAGSLVADFEALTSRGDFKEVFFSDDDIKKMMRTIAVEDWQKEVTEEIISRFEANGMVKLNLRTQWKAFKTYEYAKKNGLDWKKEVGEELKNISKIRALLYTLIGDKAIKTADLKRLLLKQEVLSTLRSADRKVHEWLYLGELYKVGEGEKDFLVCINDLNAEKTANKGV